MIKYTICKISACKSSYGTASLDVPSGSKEKRLIKSFLIQLLILLGLVTAQTGCKKFVEAQIPSTSLSGSAVFAADGTAVSVLNGLYTDISSSDPTRAGNITSLSLYSGLSADEFTLWPTLTAGIVSGYNAYFQNALTPTGNGTEFWTKFYSNIFICNDAIEGITKSTNLSPFVRQQLLGEAKFMRAFFYFYLVNLYGDIPLALTNDYNINNGLERSPKSVVYTQIISDLLDAQNLLSTKFLDGSLLNSYNERVRPSKWSATAMLARAYLYMQKWKEAEEQASLLINNNSLFSLTTLSNTFLRASLANKEAIWQLQPVLSGVTNTLEGYFFVPSTSTPGAIVPYQISNSLYNSFETGDNRKTSWIGSVKILDSIYYFPYKYKVKDITAPVTEFSTILRLGEQYLIRAEARAYLNNITGANSAASDLNMIRQRAGLPPTSASSQGQILIEILHERQVELFTELGHRWLDLKRTGTVDAIMGIPGNACAAKGGNWNSDFQLYPISAPDIQNDPKLKQNPGY